MLVVAACGGGEMSLAEYADRMNEIEATASARAAAILDAAEQKGDISPQDVGEGLEMAHDIRLEVEEAAADIDPPAQIADLHDRIFDWHREFMDVEAALADRAAEAPDTPEGWTALSDRPEMADYRAAIAEGKVICDEFQGELDATSERGVFDDVPWAPSRVQEAVEAVLGCAWFPEDPTAVYRYPPP